MVGCGNSKCGGVRNGCEVWENVSSCRVGEVFEFTRQGRGVDLLVGCCFPDSFVYHISFVS